MKEIRLCTKIYQHAANWDINPGSRKQIWKFPIKFLITCEYGSFITFKSTSFVLPLSHK